MEICGGMLGTMCVFAYALLSTRTGAGPVVMGVAVGVVGIVLYAMSISRTLERNSGKRIPMGAPLLCLRARWTCLPESVCRCLQRAP